MAPVHRTRPVPRRAGLSQGFTILEVLLAVVILTIGASAVIAMQAVVSNANRQTVQRIEAAVIADQALARMQLVGTQWTDNSWPANGFNGLTAENLERATGLDFAEWSVYETDNLEGQNTWNRLGAVASGDEEPGDLARVASRYCVGVRLRRPTGDVATATAGDGALGVIIADARVYWARARRAEDLFADCVAGLDQINDVAEAEFGTAVGDFRGGDVVMLQRSAVILRNVWWRGANVDLDGGA